MTQEIKIGSTVKYRVEFSDEVGMTYTVINMDVAANWALISANVDMRIQPTYTANLTDLILIH